ncbi:hypothetical protein, partial [Pseudomonas sp. MWU12-2115]|uniref:hypothetical protein n=1 Tax=Pseudomonas sp. MWU12-2115 TaxID=2071713 RepID=UPI001C4997A5
VQIACSLMKAPCQQDMSGLFTSLSTKLCTASVDAAKFPLENRLLANFLTLVWEMSFFIGGKSLPTVAENPGNR